MTVPCTIAATANEEPTVLSIRGDKINALRNNQTLTLKRDPFNWPAAQVAKFKSYDKKNSANFFAGLLLTGIIWDQKKPLAVINGKMLGVGDIINGAKVRKIHKESVLLQKYGTNYTLEFEPVIFGLEPKK
jgi:hypothetical protein